MRFVVQQQRFAGLCLGLAFAGAVLYLNGLAATLQLGDANLPGMLLIPDLPMPLYVVMAVVVGAGLGVTLLAALRQRRRSLATEPQRESEAIRSSWQTWLSTLGTLVLCLLILGWLLRHGPEVLQVLERLRLKIGLAQEYLETQAHRQIQSVHSPTTGYAMFVLVILVYGGIGALGLWLLCESWKKLSFGAEDEAPHPRHVRRAVAAGLQELHLHADPRQAIIACYARLEYLLEDHGMPIAAALTPQEYMGEALRELELPLEAFAELVQLFELARYSLHPLDQTARATAIACLERLDEALSQEPAHAINA